MLQIVSGKYFDEKEFYGKLKKIKIVYSNFFYTLPIITPYFSITLVKKDDYPYTYIIEYVINFEKPDSHLKSRIVDFEIFNQILTVCSFSFRAYFSLDKKIVESLCKKESGIELGHPSDYVSNYLEETKEVSSLDIRNFQKFVIKIVNLSREDFKIIISALKTIYDSIGIIAFNFDLSYSMLIYSLESISQNIEISSPKWEYYDPSIKSELDYEFKSICEGNSDRIKKVLLSNSHEKAQEKYIHFIEKNTNESFFIDETWSLKRPVKRSEFRRAIKNAYSTRSGYVHGLIEVFVNLKVYFFASYDIVEYENKPHFTYQGLLRLSNHVILSFIENREIIEHQKFDWKHNLPGIISLNIHPKHHIFLCNSFNVNQATQKYSEFLMIFTESIILSEPFFEMNELLTKFQNEIIKNKANLLDKISMYATYYLFNYFVEETGRLPQCFKIINDNVHLLQTCDIRNFPIRLMLGIGLPWDKNKIKLEFSKYIDNKFNKNSFKLTDFFETLIASYIGNIYLSEMDLSNYLEMYKFALDNNPGKRNLQNGIINAIFSKKGLSHSELISLFKSDSPK